MSEKPRPHIKFGTDGWRAQFDEDFTIANVRSCAQGVAALIQTEQSTKTGIVVGYDTRHLSLDSASEAARIFTSNEIPTYLCSKVTPTPVVSFNILNRDAAGGVIITASHNPSTWNGFKYRPSYAGSAAPSIVKKLERFINEATTNHVDNTWSLDAARDKGLLIEIDAACSYKEHVANIFNVDGIRSGGFNVLVDSMHGAGGGYIREIIGSCSTSIHEVRGLPDPTFPGMIQPEPISRNLKSSMELMRSGKYDVGLATDGDADRLGIIDEKGQFISTLQVFALLCLHQLDTLNRRGPIVRSVTQSSMIDKLGAQYQVPIHITPVGFKFLGPKMHEINALAAGEESGGYAFIGNIPERDGIFSALVFLELIHKTGKTPSELVKSLHEKVGPHHYDRLDIALTPAEHARLGNNFTQHYPRSIGGLNIIGYDNTDGLRLLLDEGFWCLIRQSGTEPLIRLYAEADSAARTDKILKDLKSHIGI